jgi:hypothetical protein
MALSIQHGSRSKRIDGVRTESSVTWQGTFEEITAFQSTLEIGSIDPDLGTLTNISLAQRDGCIWNLTLDYKEVFAVIDSGDKDKEPVEQELSATVMSVPIEAHPNYRTCWNHFLVASCNYEGDNYTNQLPSWYYTARDPYLDPTTKDGQNYRWVKQLSEAPPATKYIQWGIVKSGNTVCRPTKPGVTSYDKAYFVIKETGFHSKKSHAGWATRDLINTVVDKPLLGDFSLTRPGYNWKVDDIQVAFNGEEWVAVRTYTLSGDSNGWDPDLYP